MQHLKSPPVFQNVASSLNHLDKALNLLCPSVIHQSDASAPFSSSLSSSRSPSSWSLSSTFSPHSCESGLQSISKSEPSGSTAAFSDKSSRTLSDTWSIIRPLSFQISPLLFRYGPRSQMCSLWLTFSLQNFQFSLVHMVRTNCRVSPIQPYAKLQRSMTWVSSMELCRVHSFDFRFPRKKAPWWSFPSEPTLLGKNSLLSLPLVPIIDFHLARYSSVWLPAAEECLCFDFSFDEANADILEPELRLALGK